MDPLSITASIISVLQLTCKVLSCLNVVKDAPKERIQCAIDISNVYNLLITLRFRLEEGTSAESWYTSVRALAIEDGPLDQFKAALFALHTRLRGRGRLKRAGDMLIWKFKREEIDHILSRIERLKSLVGLALETDHL